MLMLYIMAFLKLYGVYLSLIGTKHLRSSHILDSKEFVLYEKFWLQNYSKKLVRTRDTPCVS